MFILMVRICNKNLYSCGENPASRFVFSKEESLWVTSLPGYKYLLVKETPDISLKFDSTFFVYYLLSYNLTFLVMLQLRGKFKTCGFVLEMLMRNKFLKFLIQMPWHWCLTLYLMYRFIRVFLPSSRTSTLLGAVGMCYRGRCFALWDQVSNSSYFFPVF